jgi:aspartate kinase
MQIVVKKFGGTSLANVDCIRHVANVIHQAHQKQQSCVIVVSAMAGTTNQLEHWANQVGASLGPNSDRDMILSSGEMITAGLLSLALQARGIKSRSWTGWQVPIVTTEDWGRSDSVFVGTQGLLADISQGIIPVICGFQGVTPGGRTTTLGRGGSDTTAVIIASALDAKTCEIFTDVQGVYSADPAYVKSASPYSSLSYESMLMLSQHGAKVMHAKAIEWAQRHRIPIHVLSTMKPDQSGTWIMDNAPDVCGIVYKPVLSWRMDCLPQGEIFQERSRENRCGIAFVDWVVSAKGLHFLTWAEDYHQVRSQWPDARYSDPKMLISLIGSSPATAQAMTSHASIPIEHCVRQSGMIGVMIEQKHAYDMIRHAHKHLEMYAKSSGV